MLLPGGTEENDGPQSDQRITVPKFETGMFRGRQIFQKRRSDVKILGSRRVT